MLTLDEALQIALVQNYALRESRLNVENADAQIREGWGQLYPQISAASDYTRNLKSANPFAGSAAGGLFEGLGFLGWLSFNEQARTDSDPATDPIPYIEFLQRQQQGLEQAGIQLSTGGNPFAIPNQFVSGISVTQKVFDMRAFLGASGASRYLRDLSESQFDRQEQLLIDQVKQVFYQSLLAKEQARVVSASVTRTQATLDEVARQVSQGITPKFQRLSAEVELANLETELVQAENQASTSLDNLKMTLGIPMNQTVGIRGTLEAEAPGPYLNVAVEGAVDLATRRRPDLQQADINVGLMGLQRKAERATAYPTLDAFANFNYIGNVPDNRTFTLSDPTDPFQFSQGQNGFFSQAYWDQSYSVGLRVRWTIFNGFQTRARVQQRQIALQQAEIQREELTQSIRLEVEQALRNLEAARQRITSQERNVERAELNYEYVRTRLREGVADRLEERDASGLLDQSRINYLQAVHDYLIARTAFETAVGMPINGTTGNTDLTSN
jgi:outer membrane protein TolC